MNKIFLTTTIVTVVGVVFSYSKTANSGQSGNQEHVVLFDYDKDRCGLTDTPDEPPRFFRDMKGRIHLMATSQESRDSIGNDFSSFKHNCRVVFKGSELADPLAYNDRQWLTSFWTTDGITVTAIIHNEFQADLRKSICPSGVYLKCWENSLTLATSTDAGSHYLERVAPANVVAALPYPYPREYGHPIGYFQPTNILEVDNQYFALIHAEKYLQQEWGSCVLRTSTVEKPDSWRAWGGHSFNRILSLTNLSSDPLEHTCVPVGKGSLFDIGSVLYDPNSKEFIAVSSIPEVAASTYSPSGAYLSTSKDLIVWSKPQLVCSKHDLQMYDKADDTYGFFSLVDENSKRRNFDYISNNPLIFLYYVEQDQKHPPYVRRLIRRKMSLSRNMTDQSTTTLTISCKTSN